MPIDDLAKNSDGIEEVPSDQADVSSDAPSLEDQVTQFKNEWLRSVAELENVRKRFQKEKEDLQKFVISHFAKDLLSVSDNLSRALQSTMTSDSSEKSIESIRKGIEMIGQELEKVFQKHNIQKVQAIGTRFDPNFHQAIYEVETGSESGIVMEILQEGYTIHDRLLRPAMVAVSKSQPKSIQDPPPSSDSDQS